MAGVLLGLGFLYFLKSEQKKIYPSVLNLEISGWFRSICLKLTVFLYINLSTKCEGQASEQAPKWESHERNMSYVFNNHLLSSSVFNLVSYVFLDI